MTNVSSNLIVHLARVHNIGGHPCDQCDFVAGMPAVLKRHKDKHGSFACEHCTFVTNLKGEFKKHASYAHTGRVLQCDRCDYAATRADALRKVFNKNRTICYLLVTCRSSVSGLPVGA